ncbi:glycoside hydrolase family 79 protein [Xylariomycetidae sp. FL0641]|nr:glycoside hydrolase family 79 protein [Xylariomycetidae sp. FL0641]
MRTMATFSLRSSVWAALSGLSAVAAFDYPIQVAAPEKVPGDASQIVPHDFASFSFPAHFFSDYCGNITHPNLFSRDVLELLYNKTGAHPFIRVGGTSTDRVWYNASQEQDTINDYEGGNALTSALGIAQWVYVGPSFFGGFLNFPGTHWSWQINMGKTFGQPDGLDNAMEVAQLVVDYAQDYLESFEIGNEPDIFVEVGHRNGSYTMEDYVEEWNNYANNASERVLKNNKWGLEETRFFQALAVAHFEEDWSVQNAIAKGIDRDGHVKSISFHQYAGANDPWIRLQNSYMNHTANAGNVTQFAGNVEEAAAHDPSWPLVLGETNSNAYNLNMSQVEGVFGSSLWLIDHILMGMATNITRINLIQGTTFGYSGWVPVATEGRDPYVRAPLYGQIFAADVLGHDDSVQVYPVEDLPWNVSAYGVYSAGALAKYVVVSYDEWNATTPYTRPVQEVSLAVPGWVREVAVERLTGNGASADEGIMWAGQSWNYTDGRLAQQGVRSWETQEVKGGWANLTIPSTEAVLVTFAR